MTENVRQPEPGTSGFPSGRYDTVAKNVIRGDPNDLIRFSLGTPDAEVIRVLETEQPTVNWYRADSFIHANVRGKEVIVHLELQTHDSRLCWFRHSDIWNAYLFTCHLFPSECGSQ